MINYLYCLGNFHPRNPLPSLPTELEVNNPEIEKVFHRLKDEREARKVIEEERNELVELLEREKRANVDKFKEIEKLKQKNQRMKNEVVRVTGKIGGHFNGHDNEVKTREEMMLENVNIILYLMSRKTRNLKRE